MKRINLGRVQPSSLKRAGYILRMGFCKKKSPRFCLLRETDTKSSQSSLHYFNSWMIKLTVIKKEAIWNLAVWQNWSFGQFYRSIIKLFCFQFLSSEKTSRELRDFFSQNPNLNAVWLSFARLAMANGLWSLNHLDFEPARPIERPWEDWCCEHRPCVSRNNG